MSGRDMARLAGGIGVSVFFLALALRKVDLLQVGGVLRQSKAGFLAAAVLILFASHWLRAVRHRVLLQPVKKIDIGHLFSALMVGYFGNTVLPARLGELFRAYLVGKRAEIPGSLTLGTIVVERVLDALSLLLITGVVFQFYAFPEAVRISAWVTLTAVLVVIGALALLRKHPDPVYRLVGILTSPLSPWIGRGLLGLLASFRNGIVGLSSGSSYLLVFILTGLIWACYAAVFECGFYAFGFQESFLLPAGASLVVLVITMISVMVPASPGYVGTYHWLCMVSLSLFAVPEDHAFGYAVAVHALSTFPVALVGGLYAAREGLNVFAADRVPSGAGAGRAVGS